MIRDYLSLQGAKVLEFDSGDLLALINGIIVDPDTGTVEAFWVKPATLPLKAAVLKVSDILELKKNLYIKSDQVLAEPEDIIRISEILSDGRKFLGTSVVSEAGESYGKCMNLAFDTENFTIRQIHTQKSILGVIRTDKRIFSYNSIVRLTPEAIIVNDDNTKKEPLIATTPEAAAG